MSAQVVATTVLLAEDDANDVWLIKRVLAPMLPRMRFQVVSDGSEAIQYLSGQGQFADRAVSPLPSLVLLDIQLPGLSGIEVLRWIRKHPTLHSLVVVMLTGSESEEHLRLCYELHVNSYLKKSPLLSTPDASRAVLGYWLNTNLLPLAGLT